MRREGLRLDVRSAVTRLEDGSQDGWRPIVVEWTGEGLVDPGLVAGAGRLVMTVARDAGRAAADARAHMSRSNSAR